MAKKAMINSRNLLNTLQELIPDAQSAADLTRFCANTEYAVYVSGTSLIRDRFPA